MTTEPDGPRWCSTCGADVTFEVPECVDGHDGDCAERVCVRCGDAFLVAVGLPETASPRRRRIA